MALGKQEKIERNTGGGQDGKYDLGESRDRMIIMEFEGKLEPYRKQKLELFKGTVYQRTLTGFDLYLHDKKLFWYSEKFKIGAVAHRNLEAYHDAQARYKALCQLNDQRAYRENEEMSRIKSLSDKKL